MAAAHRLFSLLSVFLALFCLGGNICSGELCPTPPVPPHANATQCVTYCHELGRERPNENSVCDGKAFIAKLKNTNAAPFISDCVQIVNMPMSPITIQDLEFCGELVNQLNEALANEFAPVCDGPVSRCPRGPTATREDIDEDFSASLQASDKSFIRPYKGSGGVPNAYTMSFGLLTPREAADNKVFRGIPAIPVYIDLTLTAPQGIDTQSGLVESTILIDEFYDQSLAQAFYGYPISENTDPNCDCFYESPILGGSCECELDEWTVNTVFDNLKVREELLAASDAYVDCGSGWCSDVMPEGYYYKRSSYFQGSFKQSFDFAKYPFDSQEFWINFTLQVPYGYVTLESESSVYAIDKAIGGFYFSTIACEHKQEANATWGGSCKFSGERVSGPSILNLIIPSLLFVLIAFSSLAISVTKSMPRVAMTMFALLVVTQQRSQIIASLPPAEAFVWIDMYLFCCIIVIVLIMLSHAMSERLAERSRSINQAILDKVLLGVLPMVLCVFIIMVSLASTGLPPSVWLTTGIFLLVAVIVFGIGWYIHSIVKVFRQAQHAAEKNGNVRKWNSLGSVLRKRDSNSDSLEKSESRSGVELSSFSTIVEELEADDGETMMKSKG
eukprot:m.64210 g.64210  ORF g.64210 m.64210 type:complete len:615 (+) comp8106_c0_seq2:150-1994(+)